MFISYFFYELYHSFNSQQNFVKFKILTKQQSKPENCIRGGIPFKYLGLPVGANPRKMSTWAPMVEKIRSKLNSWGNRHISFGGRLVLINSVLNSIPIFYMSLMKMPVQVRKKVVRIQRDFLWGGVNGRKKLSWVKWKVICREKKKEIWRW
jgi:hypothetical protein